jgi:hypothetical protein
MSARGTSRRRHAAPGMVSAALAVLLLTLVSARQGVAGTTGTAAQAPADSLAAARPLKLAASAAAPAEKGGGRAAKAPAWDVRGVVSCAFIYNDNILSASPDELDNFEQGVDPWRYRHHSSDDLVVAPGLDLEARRDLVSLGQSRLRVRVKRWMYTNNPIKTNTDFDFFARQYVGKKQSLELFLHAAPWQYIRDLGDRSPLVDPESPQVMEEFRFQRNTWNLAWRQTISKTLSASLTFERNFRYYNRPFMENDIAAKELRGNVAWQATPALGLSADYSFEDAKGRGYDMVGETATTSDDSDPSYQRDLYRLGLDLALPPSVKWLDGISLSYLYMDYYYTTQRPLVEDPYHVGRHDMNTKYTVEVQRKLTKTVGARLSARRTDRVVESPWSGDLQTDKAFTQWQFWLELAYRF